MNSRLLTLKVLNTRPTGERGLAVSFDPQRCDDKFTHYRAGQYIALEANIDGQAVRRCYSLASPPASGRLEVGIRVLPDGRFSSWASEHLKAGDEIRALAPEGNFLLPESASERANLLFIACGSGITPVLSMIDQALSQSPATQITLVYGNSTLSTMMFREELMFLKNRCPARLNIIFMFSRQEQEIELYNGRVGGESLAKLAEAGLLDVRSFSHCYICGPKPVIGQAQDYLRGAGVEPGRIHHELFLNATDASPRKKPDAGAQTGAQTIAGARAKIKLDGRWYSLALNGEASVLDQALEQGVELPYSCMAGVCSSCRAKLIRGKVHMDSCDALEEVDKKQGYILTCQSRALTEEVEIDFDQ